MSRLPSWARWLLLGVLGLVVLVVLFTTVFPWVDSQLVTDPVLGG